jgi:hypothetical protein
LPTLSRRTVMPASVIHLLTCSCAFRMASEANGRVIRPGSSLEVARMSHLSMTVFASN